MKLKNVKVTTTSGFDGVKIEEYLEPVTAHVVVGMNFFKDYFSGFTDFFGGKSRTYQNTLASINTEVINELRRKAYSIGGNCVLSLKIDNDEVSAQGKSMMMVTALGTAAKADFSQKSIDITKEIKSNNISNEYFNLLNQKKKYIKESDDNTLTIDETFWEFVKRNSLNELSDFILDKYINLIETHQEYQKEDLTKFKNHILEYYSLIDSDKAIDCLYKKLQKELPIGVRNRIINIVTEAKLIDYVKIIQLIKHDAFFVKKIGVQLANSEKLNYEKTDIELLDELINLISSDFPPRGEKSTKKKALSSKEKEIWICECEKENNEENIFCSSCHKDIYGFTQNESKPEDVIRTLTDAVEILVTVIG
jgi:uncharacterized protein YbjQ (UPF0145 family)